MKCTFEVNVEGRPGPVRRVVECDGIRNILSAVAVLAPMLADAVGRITVSGPDGWLIFTTDIAGANRLSEIMAGKSVAPVAQAVLH